MSTIGRQIWKHRGAIGLIVFTLCLVGGLQIYHDEQLAEAKRAALVVCENSNNLRKALNRRGQVSKDFFRSASITRAESAKLALKSGDIKQAKLDEKAAKDYRKAVKAYFKIPLIDCEASYTHGHPIYAR